jgi:hypothetical protein
MAKTRKTKAEKIKSQYRLASFSLQVAETELRRDREDFGYLSSEYVVRDLRKTLIYTVIIVILLVAASRSLA